MDMQFCASEESGAVIDNGNIYSSYSPHVGNFPEENYASAENPWQFGQVVVIQPQPDTEMLTDQNIFTEKSCPVTATEELCVDMGFNEDSIIKNQGTVGAVPIENLSDTYSGPPTKKIKEECVITDEEENPLQSIYSTSESNAGTNLEIVHNSGCVSIPSYQVCHKEISILACVQTVKSEPIDSNCIDDKPVENTIKYSEDPDSATKLVKDEFLAHYEASESLYPVRGNICTVPKPSDEAIQNDKRYCTICQEHFPSNEALLIHEKVHRLRKKTPKQYYSPEEDSGSTGSASDLSDYSVSSSQSSDVSTSDVLDNPVLKSVQCKTCHKSFDSKRKLTVHERCHNTSGINGLWFCVSCDKTFKTRNELTVHLRSHNSVDEQSENQCSRCGKWFGKVKCLINHMKVCKHVKKHQCDMCVLAFRRPVQLWEHKKTHSMYASHPYHCIKCNERFKLEVNYKKHISNCFSSKGAARKEQHKSTQQPVPLQGASSKYHDPPQEPGQIFPEPFIKVLKKEKQGYDEECHSVDIQNSNTPSYHGPGKVSFRDVKDKETENNTTQIVKGQSKGIKKEVPSHYEASKLSYNVRDDIASVPGPCHEEIQNSKGYCSICNKDFLSKDALLIHEKVHRLRKKAPKLYYSSEEDEDMASISKDAPWIHEKGHRLRKKSPKRYYSSEEDKDTASTGSLADSTESSVSSGQSSDVSWSNSLDNSKSYNNSPIQCKTCHKTFESKRKLTVHERCHNTLALDKRKVAYKANVRKTSQPIRSGSENSSLPSHPAFRSNNGLWCCALCDKTFRGRNELTIHQRCHNSADGRTEKHPCSRCGALFGTVKLLINHMKVCQKNKQFQCDMCVLAFRRPVQLWEHKKTHSMYASRPYHCVKCNERFKLEVNYKKHMSNCFSSKGAARQEQHKSTQQPVPLRGASSKCHVKHEKGSELSKEGVGSTKLNTKVKPNYCNICETALPNSREFTQHMLTHKSKGQWHTCVLCTKKFVNAQQLLVHLKTHEATKHLCKVCGKAFISMDSLISHKTAH